MLIVTNELNDIVEELMESSLTGNKDHVGVLCPIGLSLHVRDRQTGGPIPGALISIDEAGISGRCDFDGNIYVDDLQKGTYQLDVIAPGYTAETVLFTVTEERRMELMVMMARND